MLVSPATSPLAPVPASVSICMGVDTLMRPAWVFPVFRSATNEQCENMATELDLEKDQSLDQVRVIAMQKWMIQKGSRIESMIHQEETTMDHPILSWEFLQ